EKPIKLYCRAVLWRTGTALSSDWGHRYQRQNLGDLSDCAVADAAGLQDGRNWYHRQWISRPAVGRKPYHPRCHCGTATVSPAGGRRRPSSRDGSIIPCIGATPG